MASSVRTAIELDKEGNKVRIFHRNNNGRGRLAWTHPYEERCDACVGQ